MSQQLGMPFIVEKRLDLNLITMHKAHSQPLDYEWNETSPHLGDVRVRVSGWVNNDYMVFMIVFRLGLSGCLDSKPKWDKAKNIDILGV